MSVRYVLTAVLPRYTMRRPDRSAPPARALCAVPDPAQEVAAEFERVVAHDDPNDARVMGHD